MKTLLIIVSLLTVTSALDAQRYFDQWYFKQCQATSIKNCTPEQFQCLWAKAYALNKTGKIFTVIGTATAALPFIIAIAEPYAIYLALFTVPVGGLMDIIGIPCMITGNSRKNQLKINPHYNPLNSGAWYYNTCQVTDINHCTPEEFQCLWTKADKLKKAGTTLTLVGTALATVTGVLWVIDPYSWGIIGVFAVPAGILMDLIGIPCSVTGYNRVAQLKDTPCYKSRSGTGLNLSPALLLNGVSNTYSIGLTASIRF
jgi:hypothetical protein